MRFIERLQVTSALLVILMLSSLNASAESSSKPSNQGQPVYIEADSVEIDEKNGISKYQGNVVLTQGSIHISAQTITLFQSKDTDNVNQPGHIIAEGDPVTFKHHLEKTDSPIEGHAQRLEYALNSEILVMIGNAELSQNGDTFSSDRITYDRSKSIIKAGAAAEGNQRVRMVIQTPKK